MNKHLSADLIFEETNSTQVQERKYYINVKKASNFTGNVTRVSTLIKKLRGIEY